MNLTPDEHELVEFLRELVRLPSLSGQEALVAEAVEHKMRALGYEQVRRDLLGNVIGVRRGARPGKRILFDAHMDVVPATSPETWRYPPFSAGLADGRVWGRGSSDTKASLAAMLVALSRLPASEFSGDLLVTASVGEEILEGASLGPLLDEYQPDLVVIGEPTGCQLGIGQRGRARLIFKTHGLAAHSSSPDQSRNAVLLAAELVRRIQALPLPNHPLVGRGLMAPIQAISQPFPSTSTQPYECSLWYDRRLVPGETAAGIIEEYQRGLADMPHWSVEMVEEGYRTYTGVDLRVPDFHPGWALDPASPWVSSALPALAAAGLPVETFIAPYCTNGSASGGERNLSTVIFGPSFIEQAHIVDESLEVAELLRGAAGYAALARAWLC